MPQPRADRVDIDQVGAKALITARQFKTSGYVEMIREVAPELNSCRPGRLRAERLPRLRTVIQLGPDPPPGCFSFDEVAYSGRNRSPIPAQTDH